MVHDDRKSGARRIGLSYGRASGRPPRRTPDTTGATESALTIFLYDWPRGHEKPAAVAARVRQNGVQVSGRRPALPCDRPPAAVLEALALPLSVGLRRRARRLLGRVENLERRLVLERAAGLEADILAAKREATRLAQVLAEQRDGLRRAGRVLSRGARVGPAIRLAERGYRDAEVARREAQALLDGHFASQSIRLGEIVKALTLLTTILVPSSLVAALYGMNFTHLPMAEHPSGFWMVLGVMAVLVGALVWLFRQRRWL